MEHTQQTNDAQATTLWTQASVRKSVIAVLVLLAVLLAVQVISGLKAYRYIGSGVEPSNVLMVSGEGEAFAVPDRAAFTASFEVEGDTASFVQDTLAGYTDILTTMLKNEGIDDADVRTVNYNLQPNYVWIEEACVAGMPCRGGRREQEGFIAHQSVEIKVKEIDRASELLEKVASSEGVTGVGSVQFTVDDEDVVAAEARNKAIADAKEQARELAKELGVGLVRIVRFSEQVNDYQPMMARAEMMDAPLGMGGEDAPKNALPMGENRVNSTVQIIYEIR
jgi:uncharacterized protein